MAKALTPTSPRGRGDVVFTPYGRPDQFRIRSRKEVRKQFISRHRKAQCLAKVLLTLISHEKSNVRECDEGIVCFV